MYLFKSRKIGAKVMCPLVDVKPLQPTVRSIMNSEKRGNCLQTKKVVALCFEQFFLGYSMIPMLYQKFKVALLAFKNTDH